MQRRLCRLGFAALAISGFSSLPARSQAAEDTFNFSTLRQRAQTLASQPYTAPRNALPEWMRKLSYDEHRIIEFDAGRSVWRREGLPFQIQFFHPGSYFDKVVQISELRDGRAQAIPFQRDFFNYHQLKVGELPPTLGFAGFRLLYPLNKPSDELGSFLGASYFRFLCQGSAYGLSARGLALNTAEPGGEEFPVFTDFWLERPAPKARQLTIYALLDSESVTGAYQFVIAPGADTVTQVHAVIFCRKPVKILGVAPLTSMFWRGENSKGGGDDFRPEVHDSDGLLINNGAGEWIWRPLTNPGAIRVAAFSDENPRAFGLLQRDRNFENYQDLEAAYQLRPSAWVEPVGSWGRGSIRLAELPTPNEFNDNIVAFWTPEKPLASGESLEIEYRLHWFRDQIHPPDGFVSATRHGRGLAQESDLERFAIDFDGPTLRSVSADAGIDFSLTVGDGAKVVHSALQKNPFNGTWRVAFALKPDGSGHPVEMRCFLRKSPHVLTETWSYLWQP